MNIFRDLEDQAGHEFTMLAGPNAGISTYYCEGCGAVAQTQGLGDVVLFHVPPGSASTEHHCAFKSDREVRHRFSGALLKAKLDRLRNEEMEKLSRRARGEDDDA